MLVELRREPGRNGYSIANLAEMAFQLVDFLCVRAKNASFKPETTPRLRQATIGTYLPCTVSAAAAVISPDSEIWVCLLQDAGEWSNPRRCQPGGS